MDSDTIARLPEPEHWTEIRGIEDAPMEGALPMGCRSTHWREFLHAGVAYLIYRSAAGEYLVYRRPNEGDSLGSPVFIRPESDDSWLAAEMSGLLPKSTVSALKAILLPAPC